ncbi:hypothetical protein IM538_08220 [Cytobacillus suaedae]|nr:hypothetical protein IM538_08220 [Cytobacillus suaedae]
MNKNIYTFVSETIENTTGFDPQSRECIRELIRKAIDFYNLHSYEEIDNTEFGLIHTIHIDSMIEENLLSKVVEHSMNSEHDIDIEDLYNGKVYRHY